MTSSAPRTLYLTAALSTRRARASSPTPATTAGWTTWTTPGSWPATASPPAFGSGTSTTSPTSRRWRTSKAPAQGTKVLPGSQYANSNTTPDFFRYYDWHTSQPSFPKDRGLDAGEGDVWTTGQDNGFMEAPFSTVTVSPATASVETGKTTSFTATVDGAAKTAGVDWAVQEARRVRQQRGRLHGQHGRHLPRDCDQHRRPHQERRCDGHRHHPGPRPTTAAAARRPVPSPACSSALGSDWGGCSGVGGPPPLP